MNDLNMSYATRGGIILAIKLPLNEFGEILADRYLTDSEKRKATALQLKVEAGEIDPVFVTLH